MEKRQREQVRRQKQMKKQERKNQRANEKRNTGEGTPIDDLAGMVPGPQPGQILEDPS